jgi:hypothetical protein
MIFKTCDYDTCKAVAYITLRYSSSAVDSESFSSYLRLVLVHHIPVLVNPTENEVLFICASVTSPLSLATTAFQPSNSHT